MSFPADSGGNIIPVMGVVFGSSLEAAITTTATAAVVLPTSTSQVRVLRVFALGADMYYKIGITGLTAPTNVDALIPQNTYMEIPVAVAQTHARFVAKSGTGFYRVELLS